MECATSDALYLGLWIRAPAISFGARIPTTTPQQLEALFLQPRAPHAKLRDFPPEQLI